MVKTMKREQAAEPAAAPPSGDKIAVTNMYRNQPLVFHFLGGSVRLGPLETQEVDRECLASPEVAHLITSGALQMRDRAASGPLPGDTPAGADREGSSRTSRAKED